MFRRLLSVFLPHLKSNQYSSISGRKKYLPPGSHMTNPTLSPIISQNSLLSPTSNYGDEMETATFHWFLWSPKCRAAAAAVVCERERNFGEVHTRFAISKICLGKQNKKWEQNLKIRAQFKIPKYLQNMINIACMTHTIIQICFSRN